MLCCVVWCCRRRRQCAGGGDTALTTAADSDDSENARVRCVKRTLNSLGPDPRVRDAIEQWSRWSGTALRIAGELLHLLVAATTSLPKTEQQLNEPPAKNCQTLCRQCIAWTIGGRLPDALRPLQGFVDLHLPLPTARDLFDGTEHPPGHVVDALGKAALTNWQETVKRAKERAIRDAVRLHLRPLRALRGEAPRIKGLRGAEAFMVQGLSRTDRHGRSAQELDTLLDRVSVDCVRNALQHPDVRATYDALRRSILAAVQEVEESDHHNSRSRATAAYRDARSLWTDIQIVRVLHREQLPGAPPPRLVPQWSGRPVHIKLDVDSLAQLCGRVAVAADRGDGSGSGSGSGDLMRAAAEDYTRKIAQKKKRDGKDGDDEAGQPNKPKPRGQTRPLDERDWLGERLWPVAFTHFHRRAVARPGRWRFAGYIQTDGVAVSIPCRPKDAAGGGRYGRGAKRATAKTIGAKRRRSVATMDDNEGERRRQKCAPAGTIPTTRIHTAVPPPPPLPAYRVAMDPGYSALVTCADSEGRSARLTNGQYRTQTLERKHERWYARRMAANPAVQAAHNQLALARDDITQETAGRRLRWLAEHGSTWLRFIRQRAHRTWRLRLYCARQRTQARLLRDVTDGVILDRLAAEQAPRNPPNAPRWQDLSRQKRRWRRQANQRVIDQKVDSVRKERRGKGRGSNATVAVGLGHAGMQTIPNNSCIISGWARVPQGGLWKKAFTSAEQRRTVGTRQLLVVDEYMTSRRCHHCCLADAARVHVLLDPPPERRAGWNLRPRTSATSANSRQRRGCTRAASSLSRADDPADATAATLRRACYAYRYCPACERVMQRDRNAAFNILAALEAELQQTGRPPYLARGDHPDCSKVL